MAAHEFTLNGEQYNLSSNQVEEVLTDAQPEVIQDLAVAVNGQWWPVKQAFGSALGKPPAEFNSRRAFQVLQRLGFEMHDANQEGERPHLPGGTRGEADSAQRIKALELAVALHAGQRQDVDEVLKVANQFLGWMTGA
jgi:hypothetical protein